VTISAAILCIDEDNEHTHKWYMSHDYDEIMAADSSHVIFVDSVQELLTQLAERYSDPECEHIRYHMSNGSNSAVVNIANIYYTGEDLEELARLLRQEKYANGLLIESYAARQMLNEENRGLELGIIYSQEKRHYVYDPHEAAKELKRRIRAARPRKRRVGKPRAKRITKDDLSVFVNNMYDQCRRHIHLDHACFTCPSWHSAIHSLCAIMPIFALLFGKHTYRRVFRFQALISLWKEMTPEAKKELVQKYKFKQTFVDWLDAEAKQKLPKTVLPKGSHEYELPLRVKLDRPFKV